MSSDDIFAPRRVGVCGSSKGLSQAAVKFCAAVGVELAKDDNVVIVSGGTLRRTNTEPTDLGADWHIVSAAEAHLRERLGPDAIDRRIETVVVDTPSAATPSSGPGSGELFQIGTLRRARGKTGEARRISFVKSLDGLLAVAGRRGTAQELAVAMELAAAVLPAPLFGGAAEEFWQSYEVDLIKMLGIDAATAERWRAPAAVDSAELTPLAAEMVAALIGALPRRCFVIMPFSEDHETLYDFVIKRAIETLGDQAIRLDRTALPGDTGRQIQDGISRCDYAIAVLDGLRPNVLYELGLAHAHGKPTILLNRAGSLGPDSVGPFDLSMQQRLEYSALEGTLVDRLKGAIVNLRRAQRS